MTTRSFMSMALVAGLLGVAGCASWHTTPALPSNNNLVLDQLVIFSDAPLPEHHRLLEELKQQRTFLSTKLGLPISDEPIHVYLFPTAEKLDGFMHVHYPRVPARRAFFVESDTRLAVYAYWGDRVAEDLRHEVAHGYLHALVPQLPLWLDEGLAEYFEVPQGQGGVNRPHVVQLATALKKDWHPDLGRLESLQTTGEMTQADYAESWAWVYFLLESSPERKMLLRNYLQSLPNSPAKEPISTRIGQAEPDCDQKLADFLLIVDQSLR